MDKSILFKFGVNSFYLLVISFFIPFISSAVVLNQLSQMYIKAELDNNEVSVEIRQLQDQQADDLFLSLRFKSQGGDILSETEKQKLNFDNLYNKAFAVIPLRQIPNVGEEVDVFAVVTNSTGLQVASSYVDSIKPQTKPKHFSEIKSCDVTNQDNGFLISCDLDDIYDGDKVVANFESLNGESYVFMEDLKKGQERVEFEADIAKPGKYKVVIGLYDKNNNKYPAMKIKNVTLNSGDWVVLSYFSGVSFKDGHYKASVLFDGSNDSSNERGFYWWILDETDNVCAQDHIDLSNLPLRKDIIGSYRECINPRFVAVLYDGVENGIPTIVKTIGDADFETLLKQSRKYSALKSLTEKTNLAILFIFFSIIIIAYSLWHLITKKKLPLHVLIFAVAFYASAAYAGVINTFETADNPNIVLTYEFSRDSYKPGSKVLLTFGMDDKRVYKTQRSALFVKTNSDTEYRQALSDTEMNSDDVLDYVIDLGVAPQQEGTYTVSFKWPGMCGSAFDYSLFGKAKFGVDDCIIPLTYKVEEGRGPTPPSTPTVRVDGACTPGGSTDIEVKSNYILDNGSQGAVAIDVEIVEYDENKNVISRNSVRIPQTGFSVAGVWHTIKKTWKDTTVSYLIKAQATAENGESSNVQLRSGGCGSENPSCGDGIVQGGEECDDGNTVSGDGCSSICRLERVSPNCGNNIWEPDQGEECDGTDTPAGEQCTPNCRLLRTCTNDMQIQLSQSLVRKGGSVNITWTPPQEVTSCTLKVNNEIKMRNAHRVTYYTDTDVKGETTYTLTCNSVCAGGPVATSTTVKLAPGWQER